MRIMYGSSHHDREIWKSNVDIVIESQWQGYECQGYECQGYEGQG